MIKPGELVFVDTGAWIALAVLSDPLHERARRGWERVLESGGKVRTSVPVVLETFTYLDRKGSRALATQWRERLEEVPRFEIFSATAIDLSKAWEWLGRPQFNRLGLVDATSFVLMRKERIKWALAFDVHFATAGFRCVA